MIEQWIDSLCKVWGTVDNGRGGLVRSYLVFEKAEFPESLSEYPCAITYPEGVSNEYGNGASIDIWRGKTEFHLIGDSQKSSLPYVIRFFARIRNAAAQNYKLGGKVDYMLLRAEDLSIQGPITLAYGSEEPHWGLVVYWTVKENVSNEVQIGA